MKRRQDVPIKILLFLLSAAIMSLIVEVGRPLPALAQSPSPRVNAPYFEDEIAFEQRAIFWFGQVDAANNYTDVRIGYNDDKLIIDLAVFDRRLWYDTTPDAQNLTAWDAASLYLDLRGNVDHNLTANTYRLDAQLNHFQARDAYQAAYQGNGSNWVMTTTPFTSTTRWRGNGLNNNQDARGWRVTYHLPFASLGLAGPPAHGTVWGLALALHDRDDEAGASIPDQRWPETGAAQNPSTWGELAFGMPEYTPAPAEPVDTAVIRHGLKGATVTDGHVGGHTVCGRDYRPNFFNGWGEANYAGFEQINIQNQFDIADWPCFSKYYVTFPLSNLPPDKVIISATLTMHFFGNAGAAGQAQPSLIQVMTVTDPWDEAALTWNNGPLAGENVAASWVDPVSEFPGHPGVPVAWDVSRAVAETYAAGEPLRLGLYEADGAYHSGKYFVSSDTGDWNAEGRPTLRVLWGDPLGDGFIVRATPSIQAIDAGKVAAYTLQLEPTGDFSATVALMSQSPSPSLTLHLTPPTIDPPGQATLLITDTHPSTFSSGVWYTIPMTASGGNITKTTNVRLLVGGERSYLPLIMKNVD